jgi:pimeloyl-ACP methyl ester carboxylesterase
MEANGMKRIVGLVCGTLLLLGSWTVSAPGEAASFTFGGRISLRQPSRVPMHSTASQRRVAAAWTAPAGARVIPTPCKDDPAFLCGSVTVPIDRAQPSHGSLHIAFDVIPRRDRSSDATDAVFSVSGGPGYSTIESDRYFWSFILDRMARKRDIVLIDARGTGPTAIRCARLQHGRFRPAQLLKVIGACGRQLGPDADRFGTGDVAMDMEAVRRALGYPAIDMVMGSYGGVLEQAYAVRYPQRVRSIVSDATFPVTDPSHVFGMGFGVPDTYVRTAMLDCQRAPSCRDAHPDPGALFTWLAHRVARHPVVGDALDSSHQLQHVVVDDTELAVIVGASDLNPGELAGAAQALGNGDPSPLLRMGADSPMGLTSDSGDPRYFSYGDNLAASCNDVDAPWDRSWSIAHRARAYHRYIASLPKGVFAPLSIRGWEGFFFPNACLRWPEPDRFTPAVPRGAVFPNTPTLVMSGDLDIYVPTSSSQIVANEFPNSTLVSITGAGHVPMGYSDCARQIAAKFVETLHAGDKTCASEPAFVWPVIPSFPEYVRDAKEARRIPRGTDHSTASDRRVATAAMRTVLDGFIQSFHQSGSAVGPGLRGGTFLADYRGTSRAKLTFKGARFVDDVAIWGRVSWIYASGKLEGDLKIRGAGIGNVHLTGDFGAGFLNNHYGAVKINGTIGRHDVALRIPAN